MNYANHWEYTKSEILLNILASRVVDIFQPPTKIISAKPQDKPLRIPSINQSAQRKSDPHRRPWINRWLPDGSLTERLPGRSGERPATPWRSMQCGIGTIDLWVFKIFMLRKEKSHILVIHLGLTWPEPLPALYWAPSGQAAQSLSRAWTRPFTPPASLNSFSKWSASRLTPFNSARGSCRVDSGSPNSAMLFFLNCKPTSAYCWMESGVTTAWVLASRPQAWPTSIGYSTFQSRGIPSMAFAKGN